MKYEPKIHIPDYAFHVEFITRLLTHWNRLPACSLEFLMCHRKRPTTYYVINEIKLISWFSVNLLSKDALKVS